MNDLLIKVSKRSRLIDLDHSTLGIVGENLQEKLVFVFQDEFVDGMTRLEYELDGEKHYVLMEKVGQSYILPVQNVLLSKEGNIDLQLVITEDKTGTPVFKSEVFTLYCKKSIEAVGEAPSSYELWIEKANRILLEASRVNIDGKKTGNETIITITQKDGNKKNFSILDGQDGQDGQDGNGIVSIEKTSTSGLVDTYTITFTDGTTTTYTVTNGETQDLSNYVQKPEFNESQAEQDNTIEGLQAELDRYKLLENALPHTENETASDYVTLNNTAKAPMEIETIPQTSQDGEPTPDNPQEIHRTTGENQVKVVGKNLANFPTDTLPTANTTIIDFGEDKTFDSITTSFYLNNVQYTNSSGGFVNYQKNDGTNQYILPGYFKNSSNVGMTTNTSLTGQYYKAETNITFRKVIVTNYPNFTQGKMNIQIETGSSATPYTSYEETAYPISLGTKEMFNINGVYDGFVYDETEDKFYINRKIGKVVFNGTEYWRFSANYQFYLPKVEFASFFGNVPKASGECLSNYFKKSSSFQSNSIYIGGTSAVGIQNDNTQTQNDFISWLSSHNTTFVYELETPILEEITDATLISQLRAIKNALSMQGTTHIISTSSGTNLPFLIKARAVQTIERT